MMNMNLLVRIFTNNQLLIGEEYTFDVDKYEGWIERKEDGEVIFTYTNNGEEMNWNCSSDELIDALIDLGLYD